MTRTEFFEELKKGELKSVYLFYGESYIIASAVEGIRKILNCNAQELDYVNADGRDITAEQITELCSTVSFISPQKLVVVDNFPPLVSKETAADDCLLEYIDAPADAVLVFTCSSGVVKTSALYKKLCKAACAVDFVPLSERELSTFISRELKKYGKSMPLEVVQFLTQYTDTELNTLCLELNKLALGTDSEVITINDVSEIVTPSRDYKIFKLTDYILEKSISQAMQLMDMLISQREEPIYIVAVISKTFHNCILVHEMKKAGLSDAEICSELGIKDFVLRKMAGYCGRYSLKQLEACSLVLLKTDEALKSSAVSAKDHLTQMLLNLIARL